jgi:Ca-activated chloride channel family protein
LLTDYLHTIDFAYPWLLCLALVIPAMIIWHTKFSGRLQAGLQVSSLKNFQSIRSWKNTFHPVTFVCRLLGMLLLIVAMARPQTKNEEQRVEGEGVDIVLCIDVSGSMTAQDFTPNRMEAAKAVAASFVEKRLTDRIGIVIFSGESFTQCPLTTDKAVLKSAIETIRNGLLEDGTAIGDGLSTGIDRLRTSKSKSKLVILLTDGENNGGLIGPDNAKEIAKAFGIKVYTIGVGTEGLAPYPVKTALGVIIQQQKVTIDEKLLKSIAAETGGQYFRAKDNAGLQKIYTEIDSLEKSTVEVTTITRYTEKFTLFLLAALIVLLLELLLRFTVFKQFP